MLNFSCLAIHDEDLQACLVVQMGVSRRADEPKELMLTV